MKRRNLHTEKSKSDSGLRIKTFHWLADENLLILRGCRKCLDYMNSSRLFFFLSRYQKHWKWVNINHVVCKTWKPALSFLWWEKQWSCIYCTTLSSNTRSVQIIIIWTVTSNKSKSRDFKLKLRHNSATSKRGNRMFCPVATRVSCWIIKCFESDLTSFVTAASHAHAIIVSSQSAERPLLICSLVILLSAVLPHLSLFGY